LHWVEFPLGDLKRSVIAFNPVCRLLALLRPQAKSDLSPQSME
jgi:hypothetical protein